MAYGDVCGLPYGVLYPQKDIWEDYDSMNFKDLIPEGVLNPAPNLHKTTQEDLDRMKEEVENAFNPETLKEKEEEIPQFKNKIEFMQARALARKIMNSQKSKKKKKRKK
jgi:hypothetical protein